VPICDNISLSASSAACFPELVGSCSSLVKPKKMTALGGTVNLVDTTVASLCCKCYLSVTRVFSCIISRKSGLGSLGWSPVKIQQNVATQGIQLSVFGGLLGRYLSALIFGHWAADAGLQRLTKIVTLLVAVNASSVWNVMDLAYQLDYGTGISPYLVSRGIFDSRVC